MDYTQLFYEFIVIFVIAVTATAFTFLWRTCIYTRGGIFRFIGRMFDHWVDLGSLPHARWYHKVLRFIAYPLGRCIFCSGFHFTYEIFFLLNFVFVLELRNAWLIVLLPLSHLLITVYDRYWCVGNPSIEKGDWDYMKPSIGVMHTLTQEEYDALKDFNPEH